MRNPTIHWLLAIALLFTFAAHAALADDNYEGKVVEAGAGKLMVLSKGGESLSFDVPSSCKITRNAKKAELDELVAGDRVMVEGVRKGEKLEAKTISALAAE